MMHYSNVIKLNKKEERVFIYLNFYFYRIYCEYSQLNSSLFFVEKTPTNEYNVGVNKIRCVITPRGVKNGSKESKKK